ncbi:N-acetyltransferase family protein [Aquamicrobium sp. NLF2-7]|uniref:GNAT family N-acetyltransferase n=1 Tax=Aquamicrobium sp. NLF2-7 TaxID=2918753 RepID=UPI001EFABA6D|nr:GNAT family N-acetyltransferase [Aquamicrobium sp. NLF2-7]MCG8271709.1 N-acetyltransferase family protein [Aquamicrobium sp. NLF2-7]
MIRTATPDDLASITEIYRDAVLNGTATYELEPPSLEEMQGRFEALRASGYPFLVATDDNGTVLGYAYAGPFRARPAYRFIVEDSIYISPEAKGRGLGTALMRELIEEVRELGFRQFVAVIGDGTPDSPSVRLHEKLGFRHTGKLEGSGYKHGRWLDTAFMQLEMNGGAKQPPDPDSWPEKALKDG